MVATWLAAIWVVFFGDQFWALFKW